MNADKKLSHETVETHVSASTLSETGRLFRFRSAGILALAILLLSFTAMAEAAALTREAREEIEASRIVAPAVIDQLEATGQARVRIFLAEEPLDSAQDVSPAVVDLVTSILAGPIALDDQGALTGGVDAIGLLGAIRHPGVLGIELDDSRPSAGGGGFSGTCTPSSQVACLNGKFKTQVHGPFGPLAGVAATSSLSATFYFPTSGGNPANWEVMVKVLNGCSVNGRYWVFAGKATTQAYSISIVNTDNNQAKLYGTACPITDTSAFTCS